MKKRHGPKPSPALMKQVASFLSPLIVKISGEITVDPGVEPVGAVNYAGKVQDVWMSVEESGKDDTNTLSIAADVLINGTSCLTTQPSIAHVSGEASMQKTTLEEAGDTGVVQAVISTSNSVSPGDVISANLTLTRTATPTSEMSTAVIVVEIEPDL